MENGNSVCRLILQRAMHMCKEKIKLEYPRASCTVKSLNREHVRTTQKSQVYLGLHQMFMSFLGKRVNG